MSQGTSKLMALQEVLRHSGKCCGCWTTTTSNGVIAGIRSATWRRSTGSSFRNTTFAASSRMLSPSPRSWEASQVAGDRQDHPHPIYRLMVLLAFCSTCKVLSEMSQRRFQCRGRDGSQVAAFGTPHLSAQHIANLRRSPGSKKQTSYPKLTFLLLSCVQASL